MAKIEYLLLGAGGHAKVVISIVTNFGEEVNKELNTKTENIGIEIKCKKSWIKN